ncbi:WD40 repeat domain-containing protein [Kibdelosporangium aridum]|uniref:WD40 repeat domain-containing protein n=1 Tax=Kibdelosporangium aridum TaxID=2030 RepID=UPI0035F0B090
MFRVAAVTACSSIKLLDMASGANIAPLTGHTDPVTSVAFSSDGKTLVSASRNKTIKAVGGRLNSCRQPAYLVLCSWRLGLHGATEVAIWTRGRVTTGAHNW